ncbi:DUF4097 family beta strand repeat-containing protein [Catenulispora subtropica]|uniref:DUF4097 family beta strand repeat-containing protein n=1 Tax=Catenulispora subtropica TaxID=450798 RepID=A0ABN2QTV6_9ACTN
MQKFETPAAITAVVDIPAGRIQVIAADRGDTTVEVRPADPGKGRDVKAAEDVQVGFAGGVLRVEAGPAKHKLMGHSGSVEVTVQLPAGSALQARIAAGDVRGVGRLGETTVESAQGAIKLDETAGARLSVQDGGITVGRLGGGAAELTTQRGDITVTEAVRGQVVLTAQQGDLTIGAASGVSATLDAGTTMGRVTNSLNNTAGASAELSIRATTMQGDITARSV